MYALEVGEYNDIVCWSKDGKSFVVKNPQLFTLRVLQVLLQMAKFDSFTRKLGRWGFAKKRDTEKKRVLCGNTIVPCASTTFVCHPSFQRGDYELCRARVVCNSKVDIEACKLLLASAREQWYECHRDEERRNHAEGANLAKADLGLWRRMEASATGVSSMGTMAGGGGIGFAGTARHFQEEEHDDDRLNGFGMERNMLPGKSDFQAVAEDSAPRMSDLSSTSRGRELRQNLYQSNSDVILSTAAGGTIGSNNVHNILNADGMRVASIPPSSMIGAHYGDDMTILTNAYSSLNAEGALVNSRNNSQCNSAIMGMLPQAQELRGAVGGGYPSAEMMLLHDNELFRQMNAPYHMLAQPSLTYQHSASIPRDFLGEINPPVILSYLAARGHQHRPLSTMAVMNGAGGTSMATRDDAIRRSLLLSSMITQERQQHSMDEARLSSLIAAQRQQRQYDVTNSSDVATIIASQAGDPGRVGSNLTAMCASGAQLHLREPVTAVGTSTFLSHEAGMLPHRSQQASDGGIHAEILERAPGSPQMLLDSFYANLLHRQQNQQLSQGRQENEENQTLSMQNYADYFGRNP